MRRYQIWVTALLVAVPKYAVAATCFRLSGENFDNTQACNSILGEDSMCCNLNLTTPTGQGGPGERTRETCLSNGLCMSQDSDTEGNLNTYYWRSFCTSKDWSSPNCLKVCTKQRDTGEVDDINGPYRVTPCGSSWNTTRWCCGFNNSNCCANWDSHPDAITIPLRISQQQLSNGPSWNTTMTANGRMGLSKNAKIGIVVGVPMCAALFFALGVVLSVVILKRKQDQYLVATYPFYSSSGAHPLELDARPNPLELGAVKDAEELDSGSPGPLIQDPTVRRR